MDINITVTGLVVVVVLAVVGWLLRSLVVLPLSSIISFKFEKKEMSFCSSSWSLSYVTVGV